MNVCKPRNVLNVETGKPHLKNHTKKWVGLVGKSFRVFLLLFPFMLFFDSYIVFDSYVFCVFIETAVERWFGKKVLWIFSKLIEDNLGSRESPLGGSFLVRLQASTAWKVSKYGVFPGPYFPVFGLNTGK